MQPAPAPRHVRAVTSAYVEHARSYYLRVDGTPTGEHRNVASALKHIDKAIGDVQICDVSRAHLRLVRDQLVGTGRSRGYINKCLAIFRRCYRWARDADMLEANESDALSRATELQPLQPFRSSARETEPVAPVDDTLVYAILPHVSPTIGALLRLMLRTGARVGELLSLTYADLTPDEAGKIIWAMPRQHKLAHRRIPRMIPLDADCIRLLERAGLWTPLLIDSPIFESSQRPGRSLRRDSVNQAIRRACAKAFPPPPFLDADQLDAWTRQHTFCTHQIRHAVAQRVRESAGIDAAQILLGHQSIRTTERYARPSTRRLADAIKHTRSKR